MEELLKMCGPEAQSTTNNFRFLAYSGHCLKFHAVHPQSPGGLARKVLLRWPKLFCAEVLDQHVTVPFETLWARSKRKARQVLEKCVVFLRVAATSRESSASSGSLVEWNTAGHGMGEALNSRPNMRWF